MYIVYTQHEVHVVNSDTENKRRSCIALLIFPSETTLGVAGSETV